MLEITSTMSSVNKQKIVTTKLISELNEVLAEENTEEKGQWKKNLKEETLKIFEFLPQNIQGSY
ncbi:hypothetical protein ISN44_As04g008440 [Arabidopsis suecica]|uniref:Pyrophosphate-fructose-6-phosphate 1-phosphotransferase-related / pyrophosphate-dependent 6-phosphofructose-1-kinase-like protein n=2 Tax=Arabidopsis TaxID=3701 RepID=Q3E7M8_ARATH|nr:pyrophosphate-fructose-6-phosphate 1-phosphotransferase-related / pyrophosphate-dependent 6-phosphofructose-1-kinase-like protein [Arabidopsis thaliana]AEE82691.1 pyrophosphate-fructose-6-phosphate 1-phosphotransferase-related / pyrophosphate-dependent 6-phosphofructose-1-kinase-like protein [Arabidopsis thaliana]KAG7619832.1 hypothetical protein ISN44_As04g008440 [Arabidopsis suecica]|eukprot:NP_680667.1 pyrophosphate-fructose-6-phosphate 1-phosphotransferase-related / pyrophosphate-dependent 6-phosphofructose-1-kinase-like protein [Arabidopsis thaliana]